MNRAGAWRAAAVAAALWILSAAPAARADIVSNEPVRIETLGTDTVRAVTGRLAEIGVAKDEADRIVAGLRSDELAFFGRSPNANAVVGQQEIVTLFWYEWILGLGWLYAGWKFWDTWGCDAFFPEINCD